MMNDSESGPNDGICWADEGYEIKFYSCFEQAANLNTRLVFVSTRERAAKDKKTKERNLTLEEYQKKNRQEMLDELEAFPTDELVTRAFVPAKLLPNVRSFRLKSN